jgi:hypothetical protein
MAKSGPRKTNRYSHEFKATAVRPSDLPYVLTKLKGSASNNFSAPIFLMRESAGCSSR